MKLKIMVLAALAIPMAACTTTETEADGATEDAASAADCQPGDPGYPDCQTGVPEIIE